MLVDKKITPHVAGAIGTVAAYIMITDYPSGDMNMCPIYFHESVTETDVRLMCYWNRCRGHKPEGENFVMNPALQALQRGETIQWKEAIDPTTYQIYYFNQATGVTQWERPVELGPAPLATGA